MRTDWKDVLVAEWEPKIRVELAYYRFLEVEVSDEYPDGLRTVPCSKAEAKGTEFVYTSKHPIDGHECGLTLTITEVVDEAPEHCPLVALVAIAQYMRAHPDGNFCDRDDCEHPDREGKGNDV